MGKKEQSKRFHNLKLKTQIFMTCLLRESPKSRKNVQLEIILGKNLLARKPVMPSFHNSSPWVMLIIVYTEGKHTIGEFLEQFLKVNSSPMSHLYTWGSLLEE